MKADNTPDIYRSLPWDSLDPILRNSLPLLKDDIQKAKDIIQIEVQKALPVLPHLLRWTKDCNWPVSRILLPYLLNFDKDLIPEIDNIIKGHDEVWISWILYEILGNLSDATLSIFKPILVVLAQKESEEDIDGTAKELIKRMG